MFINHKTNGTASLYEPAAQRSISLTGDLREQVANQVIDQVNREFALELLRSSDEEARQRIQERISVLTSLHLRKSNVVNSPAATDALAAEIGRRMLGLGFLDLLLPPARHDLSEICIYSSGLVQVMKKNSVRWETLEDVQPSPAEITRVLDRILGPQNKSLNEANPSVNAKLPPTPANPGGGRIKALHGVIAPPGRNPGINIRLFEQKPVHPEWIIERQMVSAGMMDLLGSAFRQGYRILITGGTRTGKTTLLSALCNYLPPHWRIVKIEDPEEIWIDRPTVQTIEARPAALGTEIQPYTLANAVDDALRLSPDYLILGEVRDGHAALSLFRAMMTGHAGACTFHADSPREAIRRLTTVLGADAGVSAADALQLITSAIDLLVQIGIRGEVRRVTVIANLAHELAGGDVRFEPIYRLEEDRADGTPRWQQNGVLRPRSLAEMEAL